MKKVVNSVMNSTGNLSKPSESKKERHPLSLKPIMLNSNEEYDKEIKKNKKNILLSLLLIACVATITIIGLIGISGGLAFMSLNTSSAFASFGSYGVLASSALMASSLGKFHGLREGRKQFKKQKLQEIDANRPISSHPDQYLNESKQKADEKTKSDHVWRDVISERQREGRGRQNSK